MGKRDDQLDQEEADFALLVAQALTGTADEFAASVAGATELVAARFSVSRIARMWGNRTRTLVRRLLGTAETAAVAAAEDTGTTLPEGWDDLPGRYDDGTLPEGIGQYVTTTEHLLRAVGDRLSEVARRELAAGLDAGEDIDQLRDRLRVAFARDGAQLGPAREQRVAQTEASRAWNTATLAAARAVTGPDRPVVKQWVTRHDAKVRASHKAVDGQIRLLAEPFSVAGVPMQTPGDPTAPAAQVCNCRCRLAVAPEMQAAAFKAKGRPRPEVLESEDNRVTTNRSTFHGTQGRPGYRRLHPSGGRAKKNRKTQHANGGWLGSDRFTEDQHRRELRWYTGSGYRDINDGLRTGEYQEFRRDELLHAVAAINDLINIQDPTTEDTTLYRKAENLRQDFSVGDEFHDRGFLSTSAREEPVSVRQSPDDPNYTFYKITVPAGAQMVSVDAVGGGGEEEEFILPPGTKFRVKRVVSSGDPAVPPTYELEVINAVNASAYGTPPAPLAQIRAAADGSFQDRITWRPEDIVVDRRASAAVTASAGEHNGAMIALVPAVQDAERLALTAPGAELASELHLTLFYLGEAADWDEEQRADLISRLQSRAPDIHEVVAGRAFGANQWNANGEDPCWVWSVSDDPDRPQHAPTLETARWAATYSLEEMHRQPAIPTQHSPWQPHVCAAYSSSPSLLNAMNQRLGPVTFDRLRVAFAGQYTDIPLGPAPEAPVTNDAEAEALSAMKPRPWHNPDDTALVYENLETGDGRVFRPRALYWGAGPWPLQYADEMLGAHQGAELAGAIFTLERDGDRIPGTGVLYPNRPAGADALTLLEEKAPLGVSVDLDDVSVEFVNRVITEDGGEEDGVVIFAAALPRASVLRLRDGSYSLTASATSGWISAGASLAHTGSYGTILTGPGGRVEASAVTRAFSHLGLRDTGARVTAAAGDPNDEENGTVVHRESSGDLLMRVTRARVRGATLVSMPAYDTARIVLVDDPSPELAASTGDEADEDLAAGGGPSAAHLQVVAFVKSSASPVGARMVSRALGMKMETARGHLARAAKAGRIVRLAPGLYVGPQHKSDEELEASASGQLDLPVEEDRDRPWDGDEAKARLLDAATVDGTVDPDRLAAGFLWRDDDADPATAGAYRLPFADVIDGELRIVAAGVYAVAAALQGARGGVDIPEADADAAKGRVESLYGRLADTFDDPSIIPPWMNDDGDHHDDEDDDGEETAAMKNLVASAWAAMQDLPPMPAAWFREPTPEELPPDSGGVHYANGRVYGWVAQRGVPHAAYPGRNLTIEKLAREGLDFSHFLRARFQLDDGSTVKVGAMTMNVGHDGDGAQCDDAVCQFDNSGTVGAIVTVGMSRGGLWFSGAGAPWLSAWDQTVFRACQPSYHLRGKRGGGWELRAVLDVPVPAHSSPLVAAVIQRSNLALAASAAVVEDMEAKLRTLSARVSGTVRDVSGQDTDTAPATTPDLPGQRPDTGPDNVRTASGARLPRSSDTDAIAVALVSSERFIDGLLAAMERRQEQRYTQARQEAERLAASVIAPARAGLPTGKTTTLEGAV
ncbi:ADP-ribosyltransferase [Streptomyces griseus]|uniref:ADP-ribosyltransferase n=1 Tax=Streptomyces griseus TaxID=1911 RepID=UPI000A3D3FA8|nr:ADP-ribosyltransferase [Streptomyces fimicarius]